VLCALVLDPCRCALIVHKQGAASCMMSCNVSPCFMQPSDTQQLDQVEVVLIGEKGMASLSPDIAPAW